jgi:hypothetical protein
VVETYEEGFGHKKKAKIDICISLNSWKAIIIVLLEHFVIGHFAIFVQATYNHICSEKFTWESKCKNYILFL